MPPHIKDPSSNMQMVPLPNRAFARNPLKRVMASRNAKKSLKAYVEENKTLTLGKNRQVTECTFSNRCKNVNVVNPENYTDIDARTLLCL